jgi:indole-3-glycerol phosphate synthase/phosphoribosylanthranilate isomerase
MSIVRKIVERRRERIRAEGHALGASLPDSRRAPLAPLGREPFLICEIKRRSPSRGWIARDLNAAGQARAYRGRGILSISVLTEEDHFSGSLKDLIDVKAAAPDAAVLRKDFLLDEEDLEVSYRAGADAVLLIASVLSGAELAALYKKAKGMGMEALVEVHDESDVEKARPLRPAFTGINCRDLATFSTDLIQPLKIRRSIDWPTRLVFESGIKSREDALFVLGAGFSGMLAGESVTRDQRLVEEILGAFGEKPGDFWRKLYDRHRPGKPLVKICGIVREEDGRLAAELGADVLGFVLAPSPRRADPALIEKLSDLRIPKVAVVVGPGDEGTALARRLLQEGLIDAVQFHGDEGPDECFAAVFPYYKAVRVAGPKDVEEIGRYRCPRVLVDARSPRAAGGTGQRIPADLVSLVKERHPLWLAGGIGPENVREIVRGFAPELIDASSGLESSSGKKDPDRLRRFFKEMANDETD